MEGEGEGAGERHFEQEILLALGPRVVGRTGEGEGERREREEGGGGDREGGGGGSEREGDQGRRGREGRRGRGMGGGRCAAGLILQTSGLHREFRRGRGDQVLRVLLR